MKGKVERRVFRNFQAERKGVRSRFVVFDFGKTSTRSVATGSKGSNLEKENDFWVLGSSDGGGGRRCRRQNLGNRAVFGFAQEHSTDVLPFLREKRQIFFGLGWIFVQNERKFFNICVLYDPKRCV